MILPVLIAILDLFITLITWISRPTGYFCAVLTADGKLDCSPKSILASRISSIPNGVSDVISLLRRRVTRSAFLAWLVRASSTRRTAVYGSVRTVVSQGQRATAYLCKLR
jgi:hypothetical protein